MNGWSSSASSAPSWRSKYTSWLLKGTDCGIGWMNSRRSNIWICQKELSQETIAVRKPKVGRAALVGICSSASSPSRAGNQISAGSQLGLLHQTQLSFHPNSRSSRRTRSIQYRQSLVCWRRSQRRRTTHRCSYAEKVLVLVKRVTLSVCLIISWRGLKISLVTIKFSHF